MNHQEFTFAIYLALGVVAYLLFTPTIFTFINLHLAAKSKDPSQRRRLIPMCLLVLVLFAVCISPVVFAAAVYGPWIAAYMSFVLLISPVFWISARLFFHSLFAR